MSFKLPSTASTYYKKIKSDSATFLNMNVYFITIKYGKILHSCNTVVVMTQMKSDIFCVLNNITILYN